MQLGSRGPRDDLYCWKFRVWYNMKDCVFRHHWRTNPDCSDCGQGAANQRLLGGPPARPRWAALLTIEPRADRTSSGAPAECDAADL
ncbi:MAG: hypothetical protein MUC67_00680 [Acidobacteria bacterium]|nr:hypothetical protein [Acidobacteriota bacterium]